MTMIGTANENGTNFTAIVLLTLSGGHWVEERKNAFWHPTVRSLNSTDTSPSFFKRSAPHTQQNVAAVVQLQGCLGIIDYAIPMRHSKVETAVHDSHLGDDCADAYGDGHSTELV